MNFCFIDYSLNIGALDLSLLKIIVKCSRSDIISLNNIAMKHLNVSKVYIIYIISISIILLVFT